MPAGPPRWRSQTVEFFLQYHDCKQVRPGVQPPYAAQVIPLGASQHPCEASLAFTNTARKVMRYRYALWQVPPKDAPQRLRHALR